LPPLPSLPSPPKPPPEAPSTYQLNRRDLQWIAQEANVFKIMGDTKTRSVTLDFVPGRPAIVMPRLPGDEPLQATPPHVEEITYHLEDSMFGGDVWTALTCRGMTIVQPWLWTSWDALAKSSIILH